MTSFGGEPSAFAISLIGCAERDVDVLLRDVVGPAEHTVRFLSVGEGRQLEALHQLVDVPPVVRVDHGTDLLEHLRRVGAVHVDRLLRHHGVDAVGLPVDVVVDPVELDLELLGTETDRAEHAETAGFADRGDDVATVGEGEDRVLDPELVAERRSHRILQERNF